MRLVGVTEIVAVVGAIVLVLGTIGGVFKWAVGRFDALQKDLDKMKVDYTSLHREHSLVLVKLERTQLAFQMVATELARKSPGNNALALAKSLMDAAFKVDADTPGDMKDQLGKLETVQ